MRRNLSLSVDSFKDLALNNNNNKKSVLVCCIRECFGYGLSHALRDGSLLLDHSHVPKPHCYYDWRLWNRAASRVYDVPKIRSSAISTKATALNTCHVCMPCCLKAVSRGSSVLAAVLSGGKSTRQ